MGIEADSLLIAESTGEGILLRPAVALPVELYSEEVPGFMSSSVDAAKRILWQSYSAGPSSLSSSGFTGRWASMRAATGSSAARISRMRKKRGSLSDISSVSAAR